MTRTTYLKPVVIESVPELLEADTLYVSFEYSTCIHLCACGCGLQTVTPIGSGEWSLLVDENTGSEEGQLITLWPSILNRSCGSHYFVQKNKVVWT
ncbi:MAG TPA: DUF6527 family protein [Solirubrobacteraceae bacterium]